MRPFSAGLGILGLALTSAGFRATLDGDADELDGGIEDASAPDDASFDVDLEPGEPSEDDAGAPPEEDAAS